MMTYISLIRLRAAVLCATLLLLQAGCDLLDVESPDIIDPGNLDSPEGAEARRIGAITEFAFGKDGDGFDTDGYILDSGLMADEFVLSTTPPTQQEIDQRRVFENNVTLFGMYHGLHRARVAAEDAVAALQQFAAEPESNVGIPEMLSLAGFTYIYFGEGFCSGVPFGAFNEDSLIFGAPETTQQIFERAVTRFDEALAHPSISADGGEEIANLAAVGKGRALIGLGRFDEAEAAVADVPTDFQYVTEHAESPVRLQNQIFVYSEGWLWSVSNEEGNQGLPYREADDPRVPYRDEESVGLDNTTPQFTLTKYVDASAPVVVADGIEARLIEAEAELQRGDRSAMTATLNDLRADAGPSGLPSLPTPGSQTAAVDLLFSERAFWLFATGHRLGDMRRLVRPVERGGYGRDQATVFPSGTYIKGGQYGDDVNLPIPIEEQNNPNAQGCLDREA